jgi:hypothetical protein
MAQNTRQLRLFAAEDYTVVYESYINANLQAYDYDTIRTAMVEYVRNNYPENYNDWIESSEFVALLDLVAQFGHNLAFRIDLNARNNFISTAERQDSVYKLAEFLGYQPRRNVPAFGDMKVIAVKTNEPVIGSAGTSLGGKDIRFETTNNVNNIDDFITVMNSVLQIGNQFGSPKKQTTISNIQTQFYDLNNVPGQIKFSVAGIANGSTSTYNIVSTDLYDDRFEEKAPDPQGSFGIVYKNDGKGLSSNATGFFFSVKQGELQFKDFQIDNPIDNQSLDVNVDNINNSDVWVQTIDTNGNVVKNWTKVDNAVGYSTVYNSISRGIRDIFSVKTRQNNQITIRFADRMFGNLPKGIIRVWHRVSENSTYVVRPDDLANKKINVGYIGLDGNQYTATFTLQLKQNIITAASNETLDNIRENAPRVYAAQDRMVTADDYNTIIQSQTSGVLKIKSINRTFSGHSRYVDFTDPTGTYSSLDLFGKDATIYSTDTIATAFINSAESADRVLAAYISNALSNDELVNLYYTKYRDSFYNLKQSYSYAPNITVGAIFGENGYQWNTTSNTSGGATSGFIKETGKTPVLRVGKRQSNYLRVFEVGAMVKFVDVTGKHYWTRVVNVYNSGLGEDFTGVQAGIPSGLTRAGLGAITLDRVIPNGSIIDVIYPPFNRQFTAREKELILAYLKAKKTFSLQYDFKVGAWNINNTPPTFNPNDPFPAVFTDTTWVIYVKWNGISYDMYSRNVKIVLNSNKTSFSNITNELELDEYTNKARRDIIEFMGVVDGEYTSIGKFFIYGYAEDDISTSRNTVELSLVDGNKDKRPDNPDALFEIIGSNFITIDSATVNGKENLRFEWTHIPASNEIVDPSFTNIIDVYVLNSTYDTEFRNWLKTGIGTEPVVPTSYELSRQFASIEGKKTISDSIIYKPVKYKPLFGPRAERSLQAKFRVIKMTGANVTDNEIRNRLVTAIGDFFALNNWDFGETFYFTELAAHVHKQLAGLISSFVIVPQGADSVFGDLFQITPNTDEMFIPDVSVTDIDIITSLTDANIRAGI